LAHNHNILRFRDVTVRYGRTVALDRVTVDIPCGAATAILGPNGAGKSTLLRAILGWHAAGEGEILLGDDHPQHALPRLAYVPQRHAVDWDFPTTVRGVVEQGRYPALGLWRRFRAQDHARVDEALAELELTTLADRQIRELSGGQQQRVFLARAVAQGADIFLLDEPYAGLDLVATEELTAVLRAWRAQGRTVLAALHDLNLAREAFNHGVLLSTRLVAAGPIAEVLSSAHIDAAYRNGAPAVATDPLRGARTTRFEP
jgi:ABC-type Mn2+/Zn2+ transport system ATPase subunit